MKIALLGGGGFRAPLTFAALRRAAPRLELHELALHDVAAGRLRTMCRVLDAMQSATRGPHLAVSATTEIDAALSGASYVLCAIRVGGLQARALDERVAIEAGVVGQETVGAAGLCLVMRSVDVLSKIARHIARVAPNAWCINFTNPVGAITSVLRETLGEKVIGVCDTPADLARRVAGLLEHPVEELCFDYFGLNHLGWMRAAYHQGHDLLAGLLADELRLCQLDEARLFGTTTLRDLRLLPVEYLTFYYYPGRHLAAVAQSGVSRGEYLMRQQKDFYTAAESQPAEALALWQAARTQRERSYLSDAGHSPKRTGDLEGDGYASLAVTLLESMVTDARSRLIVDVENGDTMRFLPPNATVEVPCTITSNGVTRCEVPPVPDHARELMERVHTAESAAIDAARTRSRPNAVAALSSHPLVASTAQAERLLAAYVVHQPEMAALFG